MKASLLALALVLITTRITCEAKDPQTCTFPPGSNINSQQLENTPGKFWS